MVVLPAALVRMAVPADITGMRRVRIATKIIDMFQIIIVYDVHLTELAEPGPHQNDTCVCKAGLWDDGTNCNECPCSGTAAYPGDIDACYLVAGQSCSDESGAYTIEKGECYYSLYND